METKPGTEFSFCPVKRQLLNYCQKSAQSCQCVKDADCQKLSLLYDSGVISALCIDCTWTGCQASIQVWAWEYDWKLSIMLWAVTWWEGVYLNPELQCLLWHFTDPSRQSSSYKFVGIQCLALEQISRVVTGWLMRTCILLERPHPKYLHPAKVHTLLYNTLI